MESSAFTDLVSYPGVKKRELKKIIQTHSKFPWLDKHGFPLEEDELFAVSRSWGQKTWERYLDHFEKPRAEAVLLPRIYDRRASEMEYSIFEDGINHADEELTEVMSETLNLLNPKYKLILQLFFWEGKSERDIAKQLKIRQQSLHTLKKRALKEFKRLMEEAVVSRI